MLIPPYAQAAAEPANYGLSIARIRADRLSLPEARLYPELFVAPALGKQNISPATVGTNGLNLEFRIVEWSLAENPIPQSGIRGSGSAAARPRMHEKLREK